MIVLIFNLYFVLNFKFESLLFVCYLVLVIWNFMVLITRICLEIEI